MTGTKWDPAIRNMRQCISISGIKSLVPNTLAEREKSSRRRGENVDIEKRPVKRVDVVAKRQQQRRPSVCRRRRRCPTRRRVARRRSGRPRCPTLGRSSRPSPIRPKKLQSS